MGAGIPVNVSVAVLNLLGNTAFFQLCVATQLGFINKKFKGTKISHLFGTFKSNILRQEDSKNYERRYRKKKFLPLHTRNNDAMKSILF
jgi:hypothetical protein